MKNKTLFYHITLTDSVASWIYIFLDQMREIIDSNLIHDLNKIFITAIGSQSNLGIINEYIQMFCNLYHTSVNFNFVEKTYNDDMMASSYEHSKFNESNKIISEEFTLKLLWDYVRELKENESVLYIHSKGITGLKRRLESEEKSYYSFLCIQNWRKFLEWGVIENYRTCCDALETHDTAGVNWTNWPIMHYSGNFWWANSDYLKTLIDPRDMRWWTEIRDNNQSISYLPDRLKDELWIGCGSPKMFSLYNHSSPPPYSSLGETLIKRTDYCDKEKYNV